MKARKLATTKYSEPEEMSHETIYPQAIEFQASYSLETLRIPDFWCYLIRNGKLISPVNGRPVEEKITRRNTVEEAEYRAFKRIETWASENEAGIVVWISAATSRKQSAKIIISKIIFDLDFEKKLENRALCFSWQAEECLTFAQEIGAHKINSAAKLRFNPIFLGEKTAGKLIEIIRKYSPRQARLIETGEDFFIKERLKAAITAGYPAPTGPYAGSCGPSAGSAFNVVFGDSLNLSETYFDCPKCHRPIPSGRGITTCPHCGARKEDYNSGCD